MRRLCTPCSCTLPCHAGGRCRPRSCVSACHAGTACSPRSRILACHAGRGCSLRSCVPACHAGRGCRPRGRAFRLPCGHGLQSAHMRFCLPCGQGCSPRSWFSLPCGHGLQFAHLYFSLPCGHGLQAAQLSFRLPCTQRLRPAISSRGRAPRRARAKGRRFRGKRVSWLFEATFRPRREYRTQKRRDASGPPGLRALPPAPASTERVAASFSPSGVESITRETRAAAACDAMSSPQTATSHPEPTLPFRPRRGWRSQRRWRSPSP